MAWKGKLEKIELPLQWPEKWELWLIVRNCIRYYLVLTVYTLFLICLLVFSKLAEVTWCWLCSLGGGRMCLTGGEGDENMGGGGITPISVTPRLSCISPESEMSFNKEATRENKLYIYIFSARIHILWKRWHSPLCWVWPLGVTLSLGSIERGFTASVTGKNISQLLTWRLWMSQSEVKKS